MSLRYVLWDNDGVLVDTEEGYFLATQRALGECGIELDRGDYMHLRARGASAWTLPEVVRLGTDVVARQRARRDAYYQQFIQGAPREIPGVRAVLDDLAQTYRMAVVTTSLKRNFDLLHADRALLRYMDFVLTREDFAREKPHPDGYLAALDKFGAAPHEAIVVEDSAQGLNAARAAGLRCVVVRNHFFGDAHDFAGAHAVIESIHALPATIERIDPKPR